MNYLNPDRHFTIDTMSKRLKEINQNIDLMNKCFSDFEELNKPLSLDEFDNDCQQILKNLGYELETQE